MMIPSLSICSAIGAQEKKEEERALVQCEDKDATVVEEGLSPDGASRKSKEDGAEGVKETRQESRFMYDYFAHIKSSCGDVDCNDDADVLERAGLSRSALAEIAAHKLLFGRQRGRSS